MKIPLKFHSKAYRDAIRKCGGMSVWNKVKKLAAKESK